ncbi:hypothetical protein FRX31_017457 [Thalictrum thalictroides]|uniref:Disease resistance protein n=1 Tax=Thalictrum thalictroides TaxID=46969 RepID=A0A7J6W6D5_THATH|nr:hypothetical protein FRX31_017457 [Thalictrum thalictroides]
MLALEEWISFMSDRGGQKDIIMFPSLKHLRIRRCPKMKRLPVASSLESLDVEDCDEMLLQSLKDLPRLSSLKINCFTEVICFPEGVLQSLPALQYLSILNCTKLKALPLELGFLSELISLKIINCTELVSLSKGRTGTRLPTLRILEFQEQMRSSKSPRILSQDSLTGKELCRNTNFDEAVAYGAADYCTGSYLE